MRVPGVEVEARPVHHTAPSRSRLLQRPRPCDMAQARHSMSAGPAFSGYL